MDEQEAEKMLRDIAQEWKQYRSERMPRTTNPDLLAVTVATFVSSRSREARLETVRRVRKANIGVVESGFKTTLYSLSPDIDLELDAIERENEPSGISGELVPRRDKGDDL